MDRRRTDEELKELFRQAFMEEIKKLFEVHQNNLKDFAEAHRLEHDFIKIQVLKEARKQELFDEVTKQVLGWGVIAIIGAFGAWVWDYLNTLSLFK